MKRSSIILLLLALGCSSRRSSELDVGAGSYAEAQGMSGGGLYRVTTLDGGLCSGKGTASSPLDCKVVTDGTLTGTGSAGDPLSVNAALTASSYALFGDGFDGDVHLDGNPVTLTGLSMAPGSCPGGLTNCYALLRDVMFDDLTIDAGYTLDTNGYRVWVKNTLTLNGRIARNGNHGAHGADGSSASTTCQVASGGTSRSSGSVISSNGGANSPASSAQPSTSSGATDGWCATNTALLQGPSSTGAGNNGLPGPAGSCRGGGGGSGGGFVGTASGAGGQSGTMQFDNASDGNFRTVIIPALSARSEANQNFSATVGGGAGSCGRDTTNSTNQEASGGGGGGSGGLLVLSARVIVSGPSGVVESKGGNGGNGGSCGTHTGNSGGGGGGGGGAGGHVVLIYNSGLPTIDNSGGPGGTGGTPCVGGQPGGNGGAGASGLQVIRKVGRE